MSKQEKKGLAIADKEGALVPADDGINTPVPDTTPTRVPSEIEAALFKQAKNPLGDPDKE
jgi:hypothetical protein